MRLKVFLGILVISFALQAPVCGETPPLSPYPDISVLPASHVFDTSAGSTSTQTFTVSNTGTVSLIINAITLTGTDAAEFAIENDSCSSQTVAQDETCTINVVFSPTTGGAKTASLSIPSDDPDTPTLTVWLSGNNGLPSTPELLYPSDEQTGLDTTVTFQWGKCTDPDGDTVTYKFYYSTDQGFIGATPVDVASAKNKPIRYAYPAGLVFFAIVFAGVRGRKRTALLIAIALVAMMLMASCGEEGADTIVDENVVTCTVTGLSSDTTYYWKAAAVDSYGGTAESVTRSFSTQ